MGFRAFVLCEIFLNQVPTQFSYFVTFDFMYPALMLLVWRQEGHLACKKPALLSLKVASCGHDPSRSDARKESQLNKV